MKTELEDNSGWAHVIPARVEKDGVTLLEGAHEDGISKTIGVEAWKTLHLPIHPRFEGGRFSSFQKNLGETHMEALENCGGITSVGVICQFSKTPSQLGWRNQTSVDTPQEDDAQEAVQFLREDSLKLMNSRTLHSF